MMTAIQTELGVLERRDAGAAASETTLIEALRNGDETAFVLLLDRYQTAMLRVAAMYVASHAIAEDVVQETWLAVFRGLHLFEGRCTLKTWIFRILSNRAKTRGVREGRSIPFSALESAGVDQEEPSVEVDRFHPRGHMEAGWWSSYPRNWDDLPEHRLLSQETRALIDAAINRLPASQQTVISLRDVEGWTSDEVCQTLSISENNQRVLLHRARSKVRQALEDYFAEA